jgi:hypothetical protein
MIGAALPDPEQQNWLMKARGRVKLVCFGSAAWVSLFQTVAGRALRLLQQQSHDKIPL